MTRDRTEFAYESFWDCLGEAARRHKLIDDTLGLLLIAEHELGWRHLNNLPKRMLDLWCARYAVGSCALNDGSAAAEINLRITAPEFDGAVLAWAQRSVRMLVPEGFSTPFKAIVGSRDDFVCRADFRSKVKQNRQGELYV